eukprot:GDKK01019253.1.p1 GENE.GDKK01019253.1~~GDKK01019253.1.p1  ORF type:complete len:217 (+),score=45.38 GDKK01019253.1:1-651(+)
MGTVGQMSNRKATEHEDTMEEEEVDQDMNSDASDAELDGPSKRSSSRSKSKAKAQPKAKGKAKAEPKSRTKSVIKDEDEKPKPKSRASKKKNVEDEGEEAASEDEAPVVATQVKLRERQKTPTPPNGDGTRAFYETILEEFPYCPMAVKFCVEHGVHTGTKKNYYESLYDIFKEKGFAKMAGHDHGFDEKELEKLIKARIVINSKLEAKSQVKAEH